jgi:hypothetical protein
MCNRRYSLAYYPLEVGWQVTTKGRMVLRAAVLDRLLATSPLVGVVVHRAPKELVRPLTPEQVGTILAGVPERLRAAVAIGAGCWPGRT